MPQPQFTDFSAYEPELERRASLPITNLPVNAISPPNDPTLEIRTLIEELQKTARDSGRQMREAETARDEAVNQLQVAQSQIEKLRANERELRSHFIEVSAILRERDDAVQALDRVAAAEREAARKVSEMTQQLLDSRREADGLKRTAAEAAERIVEIQQQLMTIRQARDSAHAQNVALTNKTAQLENEIAELDYQRDAAELQAEKRRREADEWRGKVAGLEAQAAGAQNEGSVEKALLETQLAVLTGERDAAVAADRAARDQAQRALCELDLARHEAAALKARLEAQPQTPVARPSARDWEADAHEAQRHFAQQRLEMIEVVTQLQAAQLQVRELSASLAEARLQVKFAHGATRNVRTTQHVEKISTLDSGTWVAEASLTDSEARGVVVAMHQCFGGFARDARDLGLLNELHRHITRLSERARISGFIALHRHCRLFAEFTRVLSERPEKITESSTQTISQTLDFLAALMRTRQLGSLRDPATARIYVVDDQPECCEAIAMMMQEQMIQTMSAQESTVALLELASESFDLIILDVVMPDTNGFELCRQIRELPFHAATPIIFLTGMATAEARAAFEMSSGDDFVSKPFNLPELSLKVLTLMLHAQIAQC